MGMFSQDLTMRSANHTCQVLPSGHRLPVPRLQHFAWRSGTALDKLSWLCRCDSRAEHT